MRSLENEPAYIQEKPGYCGIACIQAVLESQFGYATSQPELVSAATPLIKSTFEYRKWAKRVPSTVARGDVVENLGTGPVVLAQTSRARLTQDLSVFISKGGDLDQLAELRYHGYMPIINSIVASKADPIPGSHYMTVRNVGRNSVTWFDSSSVNGGFKRASHEMFLDYWLSCGTFWYMVVLPGDEQLPKDAFRGKYV